ncbi:MAG: imidazole glycerol phosphate synthase subunit HisH [Gemmatimonadaceae bacterium]
MKIAIFDYGAGNLHSLAKALAAPETEISLFQDARRTLDADLLVLPGVGAFATAAERLGPALSDVRAALEKGLPCLGICLGMQLLFNGSEEGPGEGLGVIPGTVTRMHAIRVPHIGWNSVEGTGDPLFDEEPLDLAYFAHSFVCRPTIDTSVVAWTVHDRDRFPAAVRYREALGVQFHPEKSSVAGVRFIRAFIERVRRTAASKR